MKICKYCKTLEADDDSDYCSDCYKDNKEAYEDARAEDQNDYYKDR